MLRDELAEPRWIGNIDDLREILGEAAGPDGTTLIYSSGDDPHECRIALRYHLAAGDNIDLVGMNSDRLLKTTCPPW